MIGPIHSLPRRGGFTLLELVVGLIMVGLVGASLATAMSIAFRARTTAREQTNVVREAMIAADVVQQELAIALPPRPESLLAGPFIGYSGGSDDQPADTVEFYAMGRDAGAPPEDFLAEGPRWVELSLQSDGQQMVLLKRVRRNLLATVLEEPAEETLLTGILAFGVRYYDGEAWQEEWDSTQMGNSLPVALEVTLELDEPDPSDLEENYRLVQIIPYPGADRAAIDAAITGEAG